MGRPARIAGICRARNGSAPNWGTRIQGGADATQMSAVHGAVTANCWARRPPMLCPMTTGGADSAAAERLAKEQPRAIATAPGTSRDLAVYLFYRLTRLRLRPTRCIGWHGWCKWTPVEPAGTCPGYRSSKLGGSEDPWTTGARDEHSAIGGGSLA